MRHKALLGLLSLLALLPWALGHAAQSSQGRWVVKAPMPGRLFVFGGEAPAGTFNQTEAYDPVTDRWNTLTPTPTARHGFGAAVVGEVIYVIGGGPRPGGSYSAVNETFIP